MKLYALLILAAFLVAVYAQTSAAFRFMLPVYGFWLAVMLFFLLLARITTPKKGDRP